MKEKQKYLDELNTSFEKYYKTKSLYAYKNFRSKMNQGEKKYKLSIHGYDTGSMDIREFSVKDLVPAYAKQLKDFKRAYSLWIKVLRAREVIKPDLELRNLQSNIFDDLMHKCEGKFRNGKYILEKPGNKIYMQWGDLLSDSYAAIQKKKKPKLSKTKKNKFSDTIKEMKLIQNKYDTQRE
jgi:hypothetical protein